MREVNEKNIEYKRLKQEGMEKKKNKKRNNNAKTPS